MWWQPNALRGQIFFIFSLFSFHSFFFPSEYVGKYLAEVVGKWGPVSSHRMDTTRMIRVMSLTCGHGWTRISQIHRCSNAVLSDKIIRSCIIEYTQCSFYQYFSSCSEVRTSYFCVNWNSGVRVSHCSKPRICSIGLCSIAVQINVLRLSCGHKVLL